MGFLREYFYSMYFIINLMQISRELCLKCKGRLWCGLKYCPLLARFKAVKNLQPKGSFDGSSVDVFVGRFNYPNVDVGIISVPDVESNDADIFDNHFYWIEKKIPIHEVVSLRTNTIYNYDKGFVRRVRYGSVDELGLSKKPVYVNVELKHKLNIKLKSFTDLKPFGAKAKIKQVELQENPKIPQKVEKIVNDEMKSNEMVVELSKHFDEDYIRKVFSIGKTGKVINKKLVPTRWSITAVDDILGKHHKENVKSYDVITNYELYFGALYGNYFLILLLPYSYSYELFEMISNKKPPIIFPQFTHDYELIFERKTYAESTAGGYYATRLAITEALEQRKKQAMALVLRFVTPEYMTPLGVWVVRNAVRKTMKNKIKEFSNISDAKKFIFDFVKRNFFINLSRIFEESKILSFVEKQKTIKDFI